MSSGYASWVSRHSLSTEWSENTTDLWTSPLRVDSWGVNSRLTILSEIIMCFGLFFEDSIHDVLYSNCYCIARHIWLEASTPRISEVAYAARKFSPAATLGTRKYSVKSFWECRSWICLHAWHNMSCEWILVWPLWNQISNPRLQHLATTVSRSNLDEIRL